MGRGEARFTLAESRAEALYKSRGEVSLSDPDGNAMCDAFCVKQTLLSECGGEPKSASGVPYGVSIQAYLLNSN